MNPTATLLTLLAAFSATALAADCAGSKGSKPDMGVFWSVREVTCLGSTKTYNDDRVQFTYSGSKPSDQLCWDATENILNQCISQGYPIGYYNYNGVTYKVTRK